MMPELNNEDVIKIIENTEIRLSFLKILCQLMILSMNSSVNQNIVDYGANVTATVKIFSTVSRNNFHIWHIRSTSLPRKYCSTCLKKLSCKNLMEVY